MDISFAEWVNSHLKLYLEHTLNDLSFNRVEFEGKEYSIGDAIALIIDITDEYLSIKKDNDIFIDTQAEEALNGNLRFAGRLFVAIITYLWV